NAMGTRVLGLHAASNPARSGPYSDRRYCVDRYDDAARRYLGKPASALRWGTKIEHDGVMELVTVEDAIAAFERYRSDHGRCARGHGVSRIAGAPQARPALPATAVLGLFVVSGFAGLVYQSLWSHYLGLVLGHAAYAQSLVLAIFMGGMALGAWGAARLGLRWRRPVLAYAAAEAAIGVLGLAFHPVFVGYTRLSEGVLAALGDGLAAQLYPWLSAALLILPACILLGATFPLLSAGWIRARQGQDARVLGGLYFANSLGAAAGALAATFLLPPRMGLPGPLAVAGIANLVAAAVAASLARGEGADASPVAAPSPPASTPPPAHAPMLRAVLWAGLLSGACSFVYEIGWIRLLNQALGTTVHSFELMLASFLLGLAGGGAWVHRRGARLDDPLRTAGHAQVAMGVAALLSLLAFAQSFDWTAALVQALSRTDGGYQLFLLGSAGVAM